MGKVWSRLCGFVGITQLSKLDHYYILNNLNFVLKGPSIIEGVVFNIFMKSLKLETMLQHCFVHFFKICINSNYLKQPKGEFK